ncbi:DUF6193 family natural product biosynthesis protein [Kitasatospora sp. NPDC049285]|uniref:DUF6193 family natural product biosynthesis protein n=1 Tax=Kitasatospora sp. NPDC049285 TaxID=3157096 RepID=UPI0034298815
MPADPEAVAASSLAAELAATAAASGLRLPEPSSAAADRIVTFGDDPADTFGDAPAEHDTDRSRAVVIGRHRTGSYHVRLSRHGAMLAHGTTPDLAAITAAVAAWTSGADLDRTGRAAPFLRIPDWARAHERERLDPVELAWRQDLTRCEVVGSGWDRFPAARALLEAAFAEPTLRQLRPVHSHFSLWFSNTADHPYRHVGLTAEPLPDGRYRLHSRSTEDEAEEVADAATAVARLLAALPPDLGPTR